jgi:hypothetical protein
MFRPSSLLSSNAPKKEVHKTKEDDSIKIEQVIIYI